MLQFSFDDLDLTLKCAKLRSDIAASRVMLTALRVRSLLVKANYDPNQPRAPAGGSDGGQWTGGGSSKPVAIPVSDQPSKPPGIGHNKPPPDPPEIPEEAPSSAPVRNAIVRRIIVWGADAAEAAPEIAVGAAAAIAATYGGSWAWDQYEPYIQSYFDPPKSLDELQRDASQPKKGYEIHHIVEQTSADQDGFPRDMIESPENKVRIPTYKHWRINGWYSRANKDFGMMSPRQYLRGKDWTTRVRVGKKALIDLGVLKP